MVLKNLKEGLIRAGKQFQENQRIRKEQNVKRREMLRGLRMAYLKELADEYNVPIEFNEFSKEEPDLNDYIVSLAESNIPLSKLEEFIREKEIEKNRKLREPEPSSKINIGQLHVGKIEKGSLIGNVVNIDIFNDFSLEIINSNLDIDTKREAAKKLEELKEELNKKDRDRKKIDRLMQWFTKNKAELATLAAPFLTKILSAL